MTLLKYFLKRWTMPLLGGVLFFSGLLIANDLVQVSRDIFAQGAPIKWLLPIVLTTFPETLALVLPMAAILGGLLGTQQLSEGSEMVASQGLGVGMRSILKAWAVLSLGLIVFASINAHLIVPRMGGSIDRIENQMAEETKTRFLRPGAAPFFPPQNPQTGVWVAPSGEIHLFEVTDTEVHHMVAKDLSWHREGTRDEKASIVLKLQNLKGCYYQKSTESGTRPSSSARASSLEETPASAATSSPARRSSASRSAGAAPPPNAARARSCAWKSAV